MLKGNLTDHRWYRFFRNAVLKRFLETDIKEIRIFSRDKKSKMICVKGTNHRS